MDENVHDFYDQLAADYHSMYADWQEEVRRQGKILGPLLQEHAAPTKLAILDCTCGIGTQTIGLALQGHRVTGTDLSLAAVERARTEAAAFGVSIEFAAADLLRLDATVTNLFDVVVSFDNSLSHIMEDSDLAAAARQIRARLKPDGVFLASIRDYDRVLLDRQQANEWSAPLPGTHLAAGPRPSVAPVRVFDDSSGRRIIFQLWDWSDDNRRYRLQHFHLRQNGDHWDTRCYVTNYRALRRDELTAILSEAGFSGIQWLMPETSGYYQPVVLARRNQ